MDCSQEEHGAGHLTEMVRIWTANENFWNAQIVPLILAPLEREGGLHMNGTIDHVVGIAFGRSVKTFEAVQLLTSPQRTRRLWDDAFVLTRTHYETFVTLEWICLDPEHRAQLLLDEFALKQAHFLEQLGQDRDEIRPEQREGMLRERDAVLRRHGRGPGTMSLLPRLEERVRVIVGPLRATYPNLNWEYEFYYRDVSGFAHPSGWGLILSLQGDVDEVPMVEASPRSGYNAVFCNATWFVRILKRWNMIFRRISDDTLQKWLNEWGARAGLA
ncbi:MAG: hypothetical protein KGO52_04715 [Nitrospirota bacterium]|nr:hypothetical protein [Nitrospirota bacterium]